MGRKVIISEREKILRDILHRMLISAGFEVNLIEVDSERIQKVSDEQPEIVIFSVNDWPSAYHEVERLVGERKRDDMKIVITIPDGRVLDGKMNSSPLGRKYILVPKFSDAKVTALLIKDILAL